MIVRFARQAEQDLEDIADFIARENPARALSFVKELRIKAAAIAQAPHAFPVMQRYEHQGIRRRIHRNYAILYRVDGAELSIIHILHTARDIHSTLSAEEE